VPAVIPNLTKAGLEVVVEAGTGAAAGYPDADYVSKGAKIASARAEVFRAARHCGARFSATVPMTDRQSRRSSFSQRSGPDWIFEAAGLDRNHSGNRRQGLTSFSVELMPRTTRAQSMTCFPPWASIAGYKAVVLAADTSPAHFSKCHHGCGTILPRASLLLARVLHTGDCTRARLPWLSAYDLRPGGEGASADLGGRFGRTSHRSRGRPKTAWVRGRKMKNFLQAPSGELLGKVVAESDVVITAAVIPERSLDSGEPRKWVASMAPGSVIVDLAGEAVAMRADSPGEIVVDHAGDDHRMVQFWPARAVSRQPDVRGNVSAFLLHLVKDGKLQTEY